VIFFILKVLIFWIAHTTGNAGGLKVLIFWIAHTTGDSGGKKTFLKVDFNFPLIKSKVQSDLAFFSNHPCIFAMSHL